MANELTRREIVAGALGAAVLTPSLSSCAKRSGPAGSVDWPISLAQWSLHRTFLEDGVDPKTFASIARKEFELNGIEYVNQFYFDTLSPGLITELKRRADDEGIQSLLIMCDNEGRLGEPDSTGRSKAVANHHRWADAARELGCHSIRVNAASAGSYKEQARLAADGLRQLAEYCAPLGLNVLVENHGGLSSNGEWLAEVIKAADHPRVGTLPDFGNFTIDRERNLRYDIYLGVEQLMPFAKAVSAKAHEFDAQGNESSIDYFRMLRIVQDAQYRGWIGIEWEGDQVGEIEGIRKTYQLLKRAISAIG